MLTTILSTMQCGLRCTWGYEVELVLRRTAEGWRTVVAPLPELEVVCGAPASLMPDGTPLCLYHALHTWHCEACGALLTDPDASQTVHGLMCPSCAEDYFHCEWCGAACLSRAQSWDAAPSTVCETCLDAVSPGWRES
jgi:hypothetical protein